jgi:hypothetical protein
MNKTNEYTRYTSREERTCRYCLEVLQTTTTECEKHVLNDCPLYIKHRIKFIQNLTDSDSTNTNKTITQIIHDHIYTDTKDNPATNYTNNNFDFCLAKFCYNLFDHRTAFHNYLDNYHDPDA